MPTAAKLVAALIFAAVAWLVANRALQMEPTRTAPGLLREAMAVLGAICGWLVMGPRARERPAFALTAGITTSLLAFLWAIVLFAVYHVLVRSYGSFYGGPMDALEAMVDSAILRFQLLRDPMVLSLLIGGGLVGGLVTHLSARFWR